MPRVIFKCPHIKGGTAKAAAHLGNAVGYIATRKGVQRIDPGKMNLPVTENQVRIVEKLVREFPLCKGLDEYADYQESPTRGNASEFITRAIEENLDQIAKMENYVDYIAKRPRAQRFGAHGLFNGSNEPLTLSKVQDEVARHTGTVWLPVISLKREDAARLGFDNAENWKSFLSSYSVEMAKAMKIPLDQFRWYAAFHDQSHHPHIHMISAQWSHAVLPEPEQMAQISSTDDPPLYKLGVPKDDKGNDALITQHTLKDGKPVADELMLDLKDCQIYYEATVLMDDTVAQALNGYTVWGGNNFAQFQIQVAMDKNLTLVDEDSDGYVEFTFTCPFLRPVAGQEVLVDGASVTDVSVNYTQSPYTYKVPVNALQNESGIHPFTIVVEWNPEKGSYSYDELRQPITLATARATTESKLDLKTTGTVTGWIDPAASGLTANMQSQLTGLMLGNSPTLNNYLTQTLGLSRQQAAKAMENFLTSPAGKAHCMERSILTANSVCSWVPCVVEFYGADGELVNADQNDLRASNEDKATEISIPAPSDDLHFAGWYTALEGGEAWNFSNPVTGDLKLYARWTSHAYGPWTVTTPATCTAAGVETRTCNDPDCTATEARPIAALGHSWGAWITEREASYTETGLRVRICSRCGERDEETIPMLVQPYFPPVTPTPTPVTPVTPTPTPGTNIPDEEVPLANVSGLNDVDHFAYIAGYEDGTVRPANNITRAEVATIFFRLMTEDYRVANWSTSNTFTDASPSGWYNAAISTAAKAGILKGYADGSVKPNANITRAEFATIAARFISDEITDDGVGDFSDTANHWAAKEIRLAAKAGWVQGDGNRFRPDDPITRAEVMVLVNRMLDRVPDADHMLPGMKTWSDNPEGTWYYAAVQEATNDHDYERAEDGATEIWTALTEAKDWTALEAEWAANNGASAPKAETETQGLPDGI